MSSSRRTVAPDDGILASLERGSTNSQMRRSWLVFGATVSLLLTAMVAWLAYNNATSVRALSVEVRPEPHVLAGPAPSDIPAAPPDATDAPEIQQAAAIVDVPDTAAPVRPPLVMLPPEKGGAAPASEARPAPHEEIAQAPAPAPAPGAEMAKPHQAATRSTEKTRPAARPARALAARPPVKAAAKKTSRSAATKPKPRAPEVVDSDVALISAIVAHATHHAAERERQEACPSGKKCRAKPPADP